MTKASLRWDRANDCTSSEVHENSLNRSLARAIASENINGAGSQLPEVDGYAIHEGEVGQTGFQRAAE